MKGDIGKMDTKCTENYKEQYKKYNETDCKLFWTILTLLLLGLAIVRYFYHLDARDGFAVDEPQTFSAAVGYLRTNSLYLWDFWKDESSNVSYGANMRPFLILLAYWMKIFGVSLVSARSLSAVLGCVFILSCIFITKKLFQRVDITIITVTFILLHPEMTYLFRFIRMYALVLVLSVWFIYFAYLALTKGNHFNGNNRITAFIKRNFDFNLGYVILALVICYVSATIHNIQMVLCGGMALFVLYKAVIYREKKFINLVLLGLACIALGIVGIVFNSIFDFFPMIWYFAGSLQYWVSLGTQNNTMYFWDNVNAVSNQLLMLFGWGMAVVSILGKEDREKKDQLVYLLLMQIVSIVFFVWFANRYYQNRYLCFLTPISILIFAVGLVNIVGRCWKKDIIIAILLCVVAVQTYNKNFNYIYTLWNVAASQKVYQKLNILFAAEEMDVLAVDFDLQLYGYFASQELESINYNVWDDYDTEYSFKAVSEFAQNYPRGLVWIQATHLFDRRIDQRHFIQNWTDRIAGYGIDNYNIEIGQLNYIKAEKKEKAEGEWSGKEIVTIEHEQNTNSYWLKLCGDVLDNESKFICIKLWSESEEGEIEEMRYQLDIPQIADREDYNYIYRVEIDTTGEVKAASNYAAVDDGSLEECVFGE